MQANASSGDLAKRMKHFESVNIELTRRVDELNSALQSASGDNQRLQAELARLRVTLQEFQDKNDALARENKQLTGQYFPSYSCHFVSLLANYEKGQTD